MTEKRYIFSTNLFLYCFIYAIVTFLIVGPAEALYSSDDDLQTSIENLISDEKSTLNSQQIHKDSLLQAIFNKKNRTRSQPMNGYFRDGYRIMKDLRKLVRFIDRRSVNGYESINNLVQISSNFSKDQKDKMIGAAVAGGVVNILADKTNKQLRKRKIRFLQWGMDKVVLRHKIKSISMYFYRGIIANGFGLGFHKLRLYYNRHLTDYYFANNITFYPFRFLGMSYTRYNDRNIFSPMIRFKNSRISVSYDKNKSIVTSRIDMWKLEPIIIRLLHVNYLKQAQFNYVRCEMMLRL
jgi:hypothetical protein